MAQPVGAPGEPARPNRCCRTARPLTFVGAPLFLAKMMQGGNQGEIWCACGACLAPHSGTKNKKVTPLVPEI